MFTALGYREIAKYGAILAAIALFFLFLGGAFIYLIFLPFFLFGFVLYFFRDPERIIPDSPNIILSPADGTITHLEKFDDGEYLKIPAWRLSIFLSVFDVHLNRTPFTGTVKEVIYKKGDFLDARDNDALRQNEANTIIFTSENEKLPTFALKQIVGLIARRIVCIAKAGQIFHAGTRIGMMKFGSRTDLIIPANTEIEWIVKIGDKVSAGSSILGRLN